MTTTVIGRISLLKSVISCGLLLSKISKSSRVRFGTSRPGLVRDRDVERHDARAGPERRGLLPAGQRDRSAQDDECRHRRQEPSWEVPSPRVAACTSPGATAGAPFGIHHLRRPCSGRGQWDNRLGCPVAGAANDMGTRRGCCLSCSRRHRRRRLCANTRSRRLETPVPARRVHDVSDVPVDEKRRRRAEMVSGGHHAAGRDGMPARLRPDAAGHAEDRRGRSAHRERARPRGVPRRADCEGQSRRHGRRHVAGHRRGHLDSTEGGPAGSQTRVRNPHMFASPRLAAIISRNIAAAIASADPGGSGRFHEERGALRARLAGLAAACTRGVGARFVRVELSPSTRYSTTSPGTAASRLPPSSRRRRARSRRPPACSSWSAKSGGRGAAALFTEPQYPARVGRTIAREAGIPDAVLDPVASGPDDAPLDYYERAMRRTSRRSRGRSGSDHGSG